MFLSLSLITSANTDLLQDSCSALLRETPNALRGHFTVGFIDEEGVGAGVRREWFHSISKEVHSLVLRFRSPSLICIVNQLFNPDNALFIQSVEGASLQPNPHSNVNADHLSYFHFAGRLMGMASIHLKGDEIDFLRINSTTFSNGTVPRRGA